MANFKSYPLVILSTAIATGCVFFSSIALVHSCPLAGKRSYNTGNLPVQQFDRPGSSVGSDDSTVSSARFKSYGNQQGSIWWGIAGSSAMAGLAVAGIACKVFRSRHSNIVSDEVLFRHPDLEHPELSLTLLPREALACQSLENRLTWTR
jgi:hypothetical protein